MRGFDFENITPSAPDPRTDPAGYLRWSMLRDGQALQREYQGLLAHIGAPARCVIGWVLYDVRLQLCSHGTAASALASAKR